LLPSIPAKEGGMKRRSTTRQIREVFAILKQHIKGRMPAGELLRLAFAFIELYRSLDIEQYGDLGYSTRESFFAAAVDNAMKDGGWRIMVHEAKIGMELSDELPDNHLQIRARIQSFIGRTEWPRIGTE
jgi:hypothetical protein